MGVPSDGAYGIPEGMICGAPVTCKGGGYRRIDGLDIDDYAGSMLDLTVAELAEEMAAVRDLLS